MSDSRPVIMQCENCDKDMYEGDRMQAVTGGAARSEVDGFMQDDGAWSSTICHACAVIEDTRPDRERELLKAVQDAEYQLSMRIADITNR